MSGEPGKTGEGSHQITFDGVSFAYSEDGPLVLDGIDLQISQGEFIAVLGANGSGKSTLAKHVNALLQPTGGRVLVEGFDTRDPEHVYDIRRDAGMVFQNPDNQSVASIVKDDVAFGPENIGLPPDEIKERVEDSLNAVMMMDRAEDEIANLSGGQKQRVAIAGVLAMKPKIMILDEPGAMLDQRGRRGITRVAHELNGQGMTVLLITHFMEEALKADRVIVLDRGRIALQGTPEEVLTDSEALRSLKLELPFSIRLANDLNEHGFDVGLGLSEETLEEEICRSFSMT